MTLTSINNILRHVNLVLVVGMDPDPKSKQDTSIWIETASGYNRRTKIENISGRRNTKAKKATR